MQLIYLSKLSRKIDAIALEARIVQATGNCHFIFMAFILRLNGPSGSYYDESLKQLTLANVCFSYKPPYM